MKIGDLASRMGVSTDTIRYYEKEGLLPVPRRADNGYRHYGPEAVDDLEFIRKAQVVGLRLNDIREVLDIVSGGSPPCDHVRSVLRERLDDVDRKLTELKALRTTLRRSLVRLEDAKPADDGCRCAVIESA